MSLPDKKNSKVVKSKAQNENHLKKKQHNSVLLDNSNCKIVSYFDNDKK